MLRTYVHAYHVLNQYECICTIYSRLNKLLKCEGSYAMGGETDKDDLYIAPTIITHVNIKDAVMCDEVNIELCIYLANKYFEISNIGINVYYWLNQVAGRAWFLESTFVQTSVLLRTYVCVSTPKAINN